MSYVIRAPQAGDFSALSKREQGKASPCWWVPHDPQLELVAVRDGHVVGELRVVNRGRPEPSRRKGECEMRLVVAREFRRQGIGAAFFDAALAFVRDQSSDRLTGTYFEDDEQGPSELFLVKRGFKAFERYFAMTLHLASFDPDRWGQALSRATDQEVQIATLDRVCSDEIKRQIYEMETRARVNQPFRNVGDYVPPPYDAWEQHLATRPMGDVFVAIADGRAIGVIKGLDDPFTGIDPDWQGRGIATALKVVMLTEAKRRGISEVTTGNHEDNAPMLAINQKLGYIPDPVEVNCMLHLSSRN